MLTLAQAAEQLARCLAEGDKRIVFAESCTAGLASATLAAVPGISQWHCGSAVTYREQTKIDWLGVSASQIAESGVVSAPIAQQMACGVLERTVEADLAAAVTGHLGPDAPAELDGVVFIAVTGRNSEGDSGGQSWQHQLQAKHRPERQQEAALLLLSHACGFAKQGR